MSDTSNHRRGSWAEPPTYHRRNSLPSNFSTRLGDIIREKVDRTIHRRSERLRDVWQFLEEPDSSSAALWFSRLMIFLVVVNVAFSLLQAQEAPLFDGVVPVILFLLFDLICLAEVVARLIVSPRRFAFFFSFFNWVDLISGLTVVLRVLTLANPRAGETWWANEILHCVVPVVWLFKLLRNFEQFHLLCNAFEMAFEALPVLLFTLSILVLSFGAMIYFVEPRTNIEALPKSVWFTIVTMMTVGYGDTVPETSLGHLIVACVMIGSQLYMAIPLGIVGGSFSRVWEDRDRLLVIRRTRLRLQQWGYTPDDLLELFFCYDTEKTGELDVHDFSRMIEDMSLGLNPERVKKLFFSFDTDGSGKIDNEEFVNAIFPHFRICPYPEPSPTNRGSIASSGQSLEQSPVSRRGSCLAGSS